MGNAERESLIDFARTLERELADTRAVLARERHAILEIETFKRDNAALREALTLIATECPMPIRNAAGDVEDVAGELVHDAFDMARIARNALNPLHARSTEPTTCPHGVPLSGGCLACPVPEGQPGGSV